MRNVSLDEAQAGIKIAGRNINHLRYANDTTLMAESEKELKSLLMKVKYLGCFISMYDKIHHKKKNDVKCFKMKKKKKESEREE